MPHAVLISDFDGTMTANDFYKLVAERLLPPDALTPWEDYRKGSITHFEALLRIFGRLRASPEVLDAILSDMQPDPELATAMARLRAAGWEVVVTSAGCDWYIRRILAEAGVKVEVHANPMAGHGWPSPVTDSPTCPSPTKTTLPLHRSITRVRYL